MTFTYDRPFHMSQIHIKLPTDQIEPSGKLNTADFTLALDNVSNFKISDLISPENGFRLRRALLKNCKI